MTDHGWNPWKMTAIGMALVLATALVIGLVVANRTGPDGDREAQPPAAAVKPPTAAPPVVPAPPAVAPPVAPARTVPTASAVEACNRYAAQVGSRDKTTEVVKDVAVGALLGAAVGAAGGAIADGGQGAGKGAAIGGLVGAGGGTLYGVNENRKNDDRYRAAYASCLRSRGYAG